MKKLLYFFATWCNPCDYAKKNVIVPLSEKIGRDKIFSINVQTKPFEADKYNVDKLPTTIILDNGKEIYREVGIGIDKKESEELMFDSSKKGKKHNPS